VGGRAAGDHADEVTGRNGVGRGAAQALAGVFAFDAALGQGQAAGAHGAVFTADALIPMAQGFIWTARSKTVSMPSFWARADHFLGAGSMDEATGSASLGAFAAAFALF
jgi:hypothetical protein